MFRPLILGQVLVLALTAALQAQTTAKVLKVDQAAVAKVPVVPPLLLVGAKGVVPDSGWENPRLIPYVYFVPPEDGIWDFDFVADRVPGPHIPVLTPVVVFRPIRNAPDWVKGVRIHAATNSLEARPAKEFRMDFSVSEKDLASKAGSISLEGHYEQSGGKHCLVAEARVKLGPIDKEYELGRFCIKANQDSVSGEKDLGSGVKLHWKLQIEDGGRKLCLYAKACKDFGFPIGEQCTPERSVCVGISR